MSRRKIVVAVNVLDNADILRDYIEWYLALDVDLILAYDFGSTDGSQDILDDYARKKLVYWSFHPNKNTENYDPSAHLTRAARAQHGADWVVQCDTDELLCLDGDPLRTFLERATRQDLSVLAVRCFNMTGPPLEPGQSAPGTLTLRIDRGGSTTQEERISGDPRVPYIFIQYPAKTIVRAAAFVRYAAGNHEAASAWGQHAEAVGVRFLHYPIRGFEALQSKVRHAAEWFAANPHLDAHWGWHWRRWIRLQQNGRLREDYDRQFVSPARAAELIADGTCVVDETVANRLKTDG